MIALSVYLNKERIGVLGLKNPGMFTIRTVIFSSGRIENILEADGTDFTTGTLLKWLSKKVKVGDEVRVVVEQSDHFNDPIYQELIENCLNEQKYKCAINNDH